MSEETRNEANREKRVDIDAPPICRQRFRKCRAVIESAKNMLQRTFGVTPPWRGWRCGKVR